MTCLDIKCRPSGVFCSPLYKSEEPLHGSFGLLLVGTALVHKWSTACKKCHMQHVSLFPFLFIHGVSHQLTAVSSSRQAAQARMHRQECRHGCIREDQKAVSSIQVLCQSLPG